MVSSKESFSALTLSKGPNIHMGDDSQIPAEGRGSVRAKHGEFKNVLYVPSLVANLFLLLLDDAYMLSQDSYIQFRYS